MSSSHSSLRNEDGDGGVLGGILEFGRERKLEKAREGRRSLPHKPPPDKGKQEFGGRNNVD